MKTSLLRSFFTGMAVIGLAVLPVSAATYVTGNIVFTGGATLNGPLNAATAFTSFTSGTVLAGSGSYAAIPTGTPVAFNLFSFGSQPLTPIPLWSVTVGGTTYSFDLSSVAIPFQDASFLNLEGTGTANINDGNHLATSGIWRITATGFSTLPIVSFASVASVPEPSTSALVFGASAMMYVFRRVRSRK